MPERLAALYAEALPRNRFLGDQDLRSLVDELAALPARAAALVQHKLLFAIGLEELRLGRCESAVERMHAAEALLPRLSADERRRVEAQLLFGLGLAAMRWAETTNCVASHTADSCLLPIRIGGRHVEDPRGAREAKAAFERLLSLVPAGSAVALKARWLLNIAAMTLGEHPDGVRPEHLIPAQVYASQADFPRFTEMAAEVGLDVVNLSGGAVLEDLDGDGRLDVLTSTWDYLGPMHLMLADGAGFKDATEGSGLEGQVGGLNMIHADLDDDGDDEVLVLRGAWFDRDGRHPNTLLRNDGGGTFSDVSLTSGLADPAYPTQTAGFADYDADGDLDVFVGNEASRDHRYPSQLLRNDGELVFVDVTAEAGVENRRYSKGVAWGDVDGDGLPDLYVSNFTEQNRLYRNLGDGRFQDIAAASGTEGPIHSFPCWFWDYDNDGALDLYVAAYVEDATVNVASYLGLEHDGEPGKLYRGDGRGGFSDVGAELGLTRLATTMGANHGDLDNDGWLDFYLGTGYPSYEALLPNVMYRNVEGRRFVDVTTAGGFGHLQKGHAVAFGDIDNDGDVDVFEQMGGAYRGDAFADVLYENPGNDNHWLKVELEGTTSNRSALGARISAVVREAGRQRSIERHVSSGGSFGSSPLAVHLGLGPATSVERLTIHWPTSGQLQVFTDVGVDRCVLVREGDDELQTLERPARRLGDG